MTEINLVTNVLLVHADQRLSNHTHCHLFLLLNRRPLIPKVTAVTAMLSVALIDNKKCVKESLLAYLIP